MSEEARQGDEWLHKLSVKKPYFQKTAFAAVQKCFTQEQAHNCKYDILQGTSYQLVFGLQMVVVKMNLQPITTLTLKDANGLYPKEIMLLEYED